MGLKIFVPITDELLSNVDTEVHPNLVPFDPDFLRPRADSPAEGFKPADWISSSDFAAAKERLRASLATQANS